MNNGILRYWHKDDDTRVFEYPLLRGVNKIGRNDATEQNDLALDGTLVSRRHLEIFCTADSCQIKDRGSANGTLLNGQKLEPNAAFVPLHDGDLIEVGPYLFVYQAPVRATDPHQPTDPLEWPRLVPESPPLPAANGGPMLTPTTPVHSRISSYMQYLPPCYQWRPGRDEQMAENELLNRMLLGFEDILGPLERMIDGIDYYFSPWLTPPALLPWLATWVAAALPEDAPLLRQRSMVAAAADLYRWRGTRRGLSEAIRITTGLTPTIFEPQHEGDGTNGLGLPPNTFRVVLLAGHEPIDEMMVRTIIALAKPAHTSYELEVCYADQGSASKDSDA